MIAIKSFSPFFFVYNFGYLALFDKYLFLFIPLLISTINLYFIGLRAKFKLVIFSFIVIAYCKAWPAFDSRLLSFRIKVFKVVFYLIPKASWMPPLSFILQEEKSIYVREVFVVNYSPKVKTPSQVKWFYARLITFIVLFYFIPYPNAEPPQCSN